MSDFLNRMKSAAMKRYHLPDGRKVNMEHIAVERHFPHKCPHIADTRLGHTLLKQGQLLLGHHDV